MRRLEPGEKLVHEVRRHPFIFLIQVGFIVLLAIAPFVVLLVGGIFFDLSKFMSVKVFALASFVYSVWLMSLWVFIFTAWTDYYLDVWDITDRRIIDFDYKGFFRYETTSIRFEKIQDITVEVNGIMANIFKFGDVKVQTAGEMSHEFIIRDVPNPEGIKRWILDQYTIVTSQTGFKHSEPSL